MPLGPIDVRPIRTDLLNEIYEKIDKKIREEYDGGDSIYTIMRDFNLTQKEIDAIGAAYKEVGWSGGYSYSLSEERGERPGLVKITLYKGK